MPFPKWPLHGSLLLVGGALLLTPWVRCNLSGSMPRGLYWLSPVPAVVPSGTLAVIPPPASARPWVAHWHPLLKPVAAVSGELVCLTTGQVLVIQGREYGVALATDTTGRPLPQAWQGCQTIPDGQVFLASTARRSFDSRYFGPVRIVALSAVATPFLTWR